MGHVAARSGVGNGQGFGNGNGNGNENDRDSGWWHPESVIDPYEGEAAGGGRDAGFGAVTLAEDAGHVLG